MNEQALQALEQTIQHQSRHDQIVEVRKVTAALEFLDTTPDLERRQRQLHLVALFQRVAFADPDNGEVTDIAEWCLRQALTLLQVYPEDVTLLKLIGHFWLLRAQKYLAKIHQDEQESSSSSQGSQQHPLSTSEEKRLADQEDKEAEARLNNSNYVEARGILEPATDYLSKAVDVARNKGIQDGPLLSLAAEAFMSLGNVSSINVSRIHFHQALAYLRNATHVSGYTLPGHLQKWFDDYDHLAQI